MRRIVLLALLFFGVSVLAARAQEATTLRVSQAYVDVPQITLFFGARDGTGTFVPSIRADQLSVSVGETDVTVDTVTTFAESGRGAAYIFLADISKSMKPKQHRRLRKALSTWIGDLDSKDQTALLTFGSTVEVVQDFTSDKAKLQARVDSLRPTDQHTKLHAGLAQALELGRRRDPSLPKRRVIVVLSDGKDDVTGGMTAGEVRERMQVGRTPIYAIGYAREPITVEEKTALDKLGTFARASGGQFIEAGTGSITGSFEDLRQRIEEVHVAELMCSACETDGTVRRLQVQLKVGANIMTDGLNVRMQSTGPSVADKGRAPSSGGNGSNTSRSKSYMQVMTTFFAELPWWGYGIGALLLVVLAVGIYFRVRQEEEEPEPAPQPTPKMKTKPPEPKGIPLHFDVVGRQGGGPHEARIADRIVVGRSRDCDVVVSGDQEASRQNSEIVREDGELYIRDLGSQNGTLVNGVPISGSYRLEDGDRILIGRTELRIEVPDELQPKR